MYIVRNAIDGSLNCSEGAHPIDEGDTYVEISNDIDGNKVIICASCLKSIYLDILETDGDISDAEVLECEDYKVLSYDEALEEELAKEKEDDEEEDS